MLNDFDIAAKDYDDVFTFSKIGMAQRKRVFKHLKPLINNKEKLSILELNCGTGEDAIHFAKFNHEVVATDISKGMIEVAMSKSKLKNLKFKTQNINTITNATFNQKFDLIFSNFGGLNCLSKNELKTFLNTSLSLLNTKGKLILVLMPKLSLWERFYFLLKGNLKKAKRRNASNAVSVNVDGVFVKTWYYNPSEISRLTKLNYSLKTLKPIGIAIPPSYLEHSFLTKVPLFKFLTGLEKLLNQSFWAKYADHYLIELTKK